MTPAQYKREQDIKFLNDAFRNEATIYIYEQPFKIVEHKWELSKNEGFKHFFTLGNGSILILEPLAYK